MSPTTRRPRAAVRRHQGVARRSEHATAQRTRVRRLSRGAATKSRVGELVPWNERFRTSCRTSRCDVAPALGARTHRKPRCRATAGNRARREHARPDRSKSGVLIQQAGRCHKANSTWPANVGQEWKSWASCNCDSSASYDSFQSTNSSCGTLAALSNRVYSRRQCSLISSVAPLRFLATIRSASRSSRRFSSGSVS